MEFHPITGIFPMMEEGELAGLAIDIRTHGLRESIELYQDQIIGGRNRYRACEIAGVDPHFMPMGAPNDAEALGYVISKNLHRRHLTMAQRGDLVEKLLRARPEQSDRALGKLAGVDHKTAAVKRGKLEAAGEIPHLETRTGTDGKEQPATKAPPQGARTDLELQEGTLPKLPLGDAQPVIEPATLDLTTVVNQIAVALRQPTKPVTPSNFIHPIEQCAMEVRNVVLGWADRIEPDRWVDLDEELRGELIDIRRVLHERSSAPFREP